MATHTDNYLCCSTGAQVQRHDCRKKCFLTALDGERSTECRLPSAARLQMHAHTTGWQPPAPDPLCRYGYPRPRCAEHHLDGVTKKWIYKCEKTEDERLSPYVPLWLLATGGLTLLPPRSTPTAPSLHPYSLRLQPSGSRLQHYASTRT